LCLQTFIVKIRIMIFGCPSMIYSRTERRGNRLVARETERERVCVCGIALQENTVGVHCKNSRLRKGRLCCHENLNIKIVCLRNYLNCERWFREKDALRL
jgi:hypothetical protein